MENEKQFGLDDIEGEGDENRKGRRERTQMIRTSKYISADFQKKGRKMNNLKKRRRKKEDYHKSEEKHADNKKKKRKDKDSNKPRQIKYRVIRLRKKRLELLREKKAAKDREYEREHPGELEEIKRLDRIKRQNAKERSQARKPRPQNSLVHAAAFTAAMGLGHMLFLPRRR